LAALYIPILLATGMSPMASAALIGSAAALGDAGSPASDSTLAPSAGLNYDGKHHHIFDTCVPTFLHYNIPLFIFVFVVSIVLLSIMILFILIRSFFIAKQLINKILMNIKLLKK